MTPIDPNRFAKLLLEHSDVLVLYARQWCRAAEDIVQEAFVKLAAQPCPLSNPLAWLYKVVRNGAISEARSESRRRRREFVALAESPDWFESDSGELLDARAAADALRQLPIQQREIIVAKIWGGISFQQIADLVGISSSTAHRQYQAGIQTLRESLGVSCQKTNPPNR